MTARLVSSCVCRSREGTPINRTPDDRAPSVMSTNRQHVETSPDLTKTYKVFETL